MCLASGSAARVDPGPVARLCGPDSESTHRAGSAVRSRPFVSAGPFCRGSFALGTGRSPRRKPHGHCMWKCLAGRRTADPRLVQAQVHPAGSAVRSRPFVSAGPFCRGSFALGTDRSPRRKPHGHCMWKRLAGRPTVGAGPSPPSRKRCNVPSFCIGRALAPWIIRTRYGPQPEAKAACALIVEAPGASATPARYEVGSTKQAG